MQIAEKALKEIKNFFLLLDIGNSLLNSLLLFLGILLLSNLFDFLWYYALIPGLAYFIYQLQKNYKVNKYSIVESKVPVLNEQLRTVADNINRTNPIIDSLKDDVVKKMKNVKTSYFIDYRNIIIKIMILGGIAFLVIFLAFVNVYFSGTFMKLTEPIKEIGIRKSGDEIIYRNVSVTEGNLSEILGNKSLAKLQKRDLKLTINPLLSEVDPSNIGEVKPESFSPPNFPKEIYTSYDVSYNEKIARENQEVVRSYFEQITQ